MTPAAPPVATSADERAWGVAAHLSALLAVVQVPFINCLGPFLVWRIRGDESAFVEHQARAALNFQIGMSILMLANWPLYLLWIGVPLGWAIALINTGFILWAAIRTSGGEAYSYPFTLNLVKGDDERR